VNSLNKYLKFNYGSFISSLIQSGRYRLITFDDHKVPIISTTFYLDGDAMIEINRVDDIILAERNPQKVDAHLKEVERQSGSVQIFIKHIQAAAALVFSVLPWLYHPTDQISLKIIFSGIIAGFVIVVRKWIPKIVIRIVGKFIPMFKKKK
jgi:hypothetical protein